MQWGNGAPVYTLRAKLEDIEPDSVAAIWNEQWGPGTAGMQIDLKTQGWSAADLAQNASGKFSIVWRNGSLTSATAATSDAAMEAENFQRWDAEGIIRNAKLVLNSSRIVLQKNYQRAARFLAAGAVRNGGDNVCQGTRSASHTV